MSDEDKINWPKHYNHGKIQPIEVIEDWGLGFHLGNCVKYVARAGKKGGAPELEDLEKARWYINRRIEQLEGKKAPQLAFQPSYDGATADANAEAVRKVGEHPHVTVDRYFGSVNWVGADWFEVNLTHEDPDEGSFGYVCPRTAWKYHSPPKTGDSITARFENHKLISVWPEV